MQWLSSLGVPFVTSAEVGKVTSGLRHIISEEAEHDSSSRLAADFDVKEAFLGYLREGVGKSDSDN